MPQDKHAMMRIPLDRCRHITCSGMQVYGNDYMTPVDERYRSDDFQCAKTQRVLGPDGTLVLLSQCTPERSCYEPL